ncbi:MAG: hypothetical protein QOJ65_2525 [Fimbriimonadaceae bacterium]|jgi:hypothetical protein|nr:hypothetical protein [Fimbriimonadaceae bacterium]
MMTACTAAILAFSLLAKTPADVQNKVHLLPWPVASIAIPKDTKDTKPKDTKPKPKAKSPQPKAQSLKPQATSPEDTLCDLSTVNAALPETLQVLSNQARIGLVLLSPSDLKISTNLVRTKFIDALRHLCAISGMSYLKVGNTYIVATKDKLKEAYPADYYRANPDERPEPPKAPEEAVTEIYVANYVSSGQLAASLSQLFPKEELFAVAGPVQSNPNISTQSTSSATGSDATVLTRDENAANSAGKMLILRGKKSIVDQALDLAKRMDSQRPQVAIEVTIHDISDAALKELGISWSFGNISISEKASGSMNFGSFSRGPMTFTGVIKALEQADKAKLLASPNVSVLDGERAFILIGDRINYPVLVGYSQNNAPIFSKEEERVGIYLQVAANVSSDDNVTLSLYPQVSSITGFLNVNGASYPQISTREAQTTLRVHSGETIVMGGLLKSSETSTYESVPLLSQLPFIGELFKRRRTNKTASQVIISITPKVLRTQ